MRVILASASPRRRELLAQIVPEFEVLPADVEEHAWTGEWYSTAKDLAQAKANKVWRDNADAVVIGADTEVVMRTSHLVSRDFDRKPGLYSLLAARRRPLGKPRDQSHAGEMLRLLSHRTHYVVTGVCVLAPTGATTFVDRTAVRFRNLTDEEIRAYVATGEPMDKAGGYAIQGGAKDFVEWIDGSWSNVVGLPLEKLEPILRQYLDAKRL